MLTVSSSQHKTLSDKLSVFEGRLEKLKKDCRTRFGGESLVDDIIKTAQSKPLENPLLQSIYHYYQKVLETKKQMQAILK